MDDNSWIEEFLKHKKDWDKYTKRMGRDVMGEHKFDTNTCAKCGVASIDVHNGSASYVCRGKMMECCGKTGTEKWDFTNSQWVCSECKVVRSNDPSYSGWWGHNEPVKEDLFKPKQVDPKECTCTMQTLMSRGCRCGGK